MRMRRLAILAVLSALVALLASSTASAAPCGRTASPPPAWNHVVWIVMENKGYSQIIGSPSAPYLNRLASQCGLATNYHAITHPSLPNYIALTSGSTQGITNDAGPASHPMGARSIFAQLSATGGWRSLQESMPSNCYLSDANPYVVRHNPAAYYTGIRTACGYRDVPLGSTFNIARRFTFVTPNDCHNTHSCSIATGDSWLSTFVPKLIGSPTYQGGDTVIVVTWDEDDGSASNHIATVVIAPSTVPRTRYGGALNHYSLLLTAQRLLGLACLANSCGKADMRAPFNL
jgi:phosphatidylinositol-3-phosphatase